MNKKQSELARVLVRGIFLAGLLAATSVTGWASENFPTARPESVGISTERLARIDEYFQRFIDDNQVAGAVTLVARHGKIVHHSALGWKYREQDIPMTTDTIFYLASMTKPIVSTAVMMLLEEGRCRLDDPISEWIHEDADHRVWDSDGTRKRSVP